MHRLLWIGMLTVALAAAGGCRPATVQPENLHLTITLRTALSARNVEWLAENRQRIEERREEGQMHDDEYQAFLAILAQADAGDWEAAERAAVQLQKAQRPTREQIERLPKGK